jgi:IS5 family transposase
LKLTPGQAHDGRSAADMLESLGQGQILLADRSYDSDALRTRLASPDMVSLYESVT